MPASGLLWATCRVAGHPLHDKAHAGDLWIAASAVAYGLPLVTDDGIFAGVPGLQVISAKDLDPFYRGAGDSRWDWPGARPLSFRCRSGLYLPNPMWRACTQLAQPELRAHVASM